MTNDYPTPARAVRAAARNVDNGALCINVRTGAPGELRAAGGPSLNCNSPAAGVLNEAIRNTELAILRSGLRRLTVQSEIAKQHPRELVDARSPESQRLTLPPSFLAQRNTLDMQPFQHRVPRRNWLKLAIILFAGFMLAVVAMMLKMHLQQKARSAPYPMPRAIFRKSP